MWPGVWGQCVPSQLLGSALNTSALNSRHLCGLLPQVAPAMHWSDGDVWALQLPIRAGAHTFKAVMRRADGAYISEAGDSRLLEVPASLTQEDVLDVELDARLLW